MNRFRQTILAMCVLYAAVIVIVAALISQGAITQAGDKVEVARINACRGLPVNDQSACINRQQQAVIVRPRVVVVRRPPLNAEDKEISNCFTVAEESSMANFGASDYGKCVLDVRQAYGQ